MLSNQQRNQTMGTLIMAYAYFKDDGTLCFVDETGEENQIGSGSGGAGIVPMPFSHQYLGQDNDLQRLNQFIVEEFPEHHQAYIGNKTVDVAIHLMKKMHQQIGSDLLRIEVAEQPAQRKLETIYDPNAPKG